MTNLWDQVKWLWTHAVWFIAAIILLIDPQHIFEFAHRHEGWSALILAIWAAVAAWAAKHKLQPAQQSGVLPPGIPQPPRQGRAQ